MAKRACFVLAVLFACSFVAHAQNTVYEGPALGKLAEFEFSGLDSQYTLIRASQKNADYQLQVINQATGASIVNADLDAYLGIEELILIERKQCSKCLLRLISKSELDRQSPYKVTLERLPATALTSQQLRAYQSINFAANTLAQNSENGASIDPSLSQAVAELETSANLLNDQSLLWQHIVVSKAQLLFRLQKPLEAKASYQQVIGQTIGQDTIYRAQALFELGGFEDDAKVAFEHYVEGFEIGAALDNQMLMALAYNYQAINKIRNAEFDTALNRLDKAYLLASAEQNWKKTLDVLHNLSWGNLRAGNLPKSISYAAQQKLLAEQFNDEENTLWALYNLALAYGNLGDIHVSDQFVDEALRRLSSLNTKPSNSLKSLKAYLTLERAQRYLEMGANEFAHDNAIEVRAMFAELGWTRRVADTNFLLGDIAFSQGDLDRAKARYLAALEYDLDNSRNRSAGLRYLKLAELKMATQEYIAAEQYQLQALKKIELTQDKKLYARAQSLSVELYHYLQKDSQANDIAKETSVLVAKYGSLAQQARFAYRRALVFESLDQIKSALRQLELARSIIDTQLDKVSQPTLKQEFLALFKDIYTANVRIVLMADPDNDLAAIELVEIFKARTLREKISDIELSKSLGTSLIKQRQDILEKIRSNAVTLYAGEVKDRSDPISRSRKLSAALERLEASILKEKASLSSTASALRESPSFDARPGELIAYYFFGRDQSWLWAITEDKIDRHPLPRQSDIAKVVDEYLTIVSKPPAARGKLTAWQQRERSNAISQIVLAPLEAYLNSNKISYISIVPDGPLAGVPIAAMAMNETRRPLIEQYPVSYTPSLATRTALQIRRLRRSGTQTDEVLVFANPLNSSHLGGSLRPLPHTLEEAATIAEVFGSKATVIQSELATKENFLSRINKPYSILHLATHGLVNHQAPALSSLVFSTTESADGLLLLPEISSLEFDASLLVLSACDSGVGRAVAGEGFISLSRAFLGSGVNQVMGSLWQVHDSSTAKLMKEFYIALKNKGLSVPEALRSAQIEILKESDSDWSDPYYWAGFQLIGGI